jgi:hypothetical protein
VINGMLTRARDALVEKLEPGMGPMLERQGLAWADLLPVLQVGSHMIVSDSRYTFVA